MMEWKLEMSLVGPFGERITVALNLADHIASEVTRINPPEPYGLFVPGGDPFKATVHVLRRREYRRHLFEDTATRMGKLLANRMEDKEGWHGVDRQEKLDRMGTTI